MSGDTASVVSVVDTDRCAKSSRRVEAEAPGAALALSGRFSDVESPQHSASCQTDDQATFCTSRNARVTTRRTPESIEAEFMARVQGLQAKGIAIDLAKIRLSLPIIRQLDDTALQALLLDACQPLEASRQEVHGSPSHGRDARAGRGSAAAADSRLGGGAVV